MAATGNEVVLLRQLKLATDNIKGDISEMQAGIGNKLDAPASAGTNGQMLVYGSTGNQWADVPEGTAYSADNASLQLSGTQFSVKDGGISSAKIAADAVTADKIADGVIPDISGFITKTAADAAYAAKTHTHAAATISAAGFMSATDKTKLDGLSNYTLPTASDTDFETYLGI